MIERFPDADIRENCRARIESLELWLRRLIEGVLSDGYGSNYLDHEDEAGNRIVKRKTVERLKQRVAADPTRYPRPIDAILLEDAISIVCHPQLFALHFRSNLGVAFPGGGDTHRQMLERLVPIRNRLSHANPISAQDAARVICYSTDVIEALRSYYEGRGMDSEYNVPTIIKVADSFGNSFHRNQFGSVHDGGIMMNFSSDAKYALRPGDTLAIEIEVDPVFDPSSYTIKWGSTRTLTGVELDQPKIVIPITNRFVAATWDLQCRITSDKDWHRMSLGADDFLFLVYKVLPPLG